MEAEAVRSGSMGNLNRLFINNPSQVLKDACASRNIRLTPDKGWFTGIPIGSMGNLKWLWLQGNKISYTGMVAFANAIKPTPEIGAEQVIC